MKKRELALEERTGIRVIACDLSHRLDEEAMNELPILERIKMYLCHCPFCGSYADTRYAGFNNDVFVIECGNRFGACVSMMGIKGGEQALADKWNRRARGNPCANARPIDCIQCLDCIE